MTPNVVALSPERRSALIDEAVVEMLQEAVGPAACAEIIQDALLQISAKLTTLEAAATAQDHERMAQIAHDMVSVPGQIGMTELSDLAMALEACCRNGDHVAAQAVCARVLWIGEESLVAYQMLSGD